jgi:hypothetical protein
MLHCPALLCANLAQLKTTARALPPARAQAAFGESATARVLPCPGEVFRLLPKGDSMDRQPPDITLAVRDGTRRMTYVELAIARGISLASARRLVLRHRWPRVPGNDGLVRVIVPLTALEKPRGTAEATRTTTGEADTASDTPAVAHVPTTDPKTVAPATDPVTVTLTKAIETLCDQLGKAERRAEIAERRIGELATSLADAAAAERIAAGEAAALRAELDQRRGWRLLRRLGWALRGDRRTV